MRTAQSGRSRSDSLTGQSKRCASPIVPRRRRQGGCRSCGCRHDKALSHYADEAGERVAHYFKRIPRRRDVSFWKKSGSGQTNVLRLAAVEDAEGFRWVKTHPFSGRLRA